MADTYIKICDDVVTERFLEEDRGLVKKIRLEASQEALRLAVEERNILRQSMHDLRMMALGASQNMMDPGRAILGDQVFKMAEAALKRESEVK